jgi:outer membrane autotransporter protein
LISRGHSTDRTDPRRHAFGDTTPTTIFTVDGSDPFSVAGVPIAENAFVGEAGIDMAVTETVRFGLAYATQIASDAQSHSAEASITVGF